MLQSQALIEKYLREADTSQDDDDIQAPPVPPSKFKKHMIVRTLKATSSKGISTDMHSKPGKYTIRNEP